MVGKKTKKYDIGLRSDYNGKLDDVIVRNVKMFRMERMDNNAWQLACYLANGEEIAWNFYPAQEVIMLETLIFPKNVRYEFGSLTENFSPKKNK